MAEQCACAHRKIAHVEIHHGDGSTSERWECDSCRREFVPKPAPQIMSIATGFSFAQGQQFGLAQNARINY